MSETERDDSEFERRSRAMLDESVARLDGRTRSRLNQARQRAMAEYTARRASPWWRVFGAGSLLPAGAVAAAVLVVVTLWNAPPGVDREPATARGEVAAALEDLELLADGAVVMDGGDGVELDFYEWAAAEAEVMET